MYCDYEFLVALAKAFIMFGGIFLAAYLAYRIVRLLLVKLYVYQSLTTRTRSDIEKIIELSEKITVPGRLPENYGVLWRSAMRNRDNLDLMKSAVAIFELALCGYKQPVGDSSNKLELIRLLEQFKEEATTQKKSFYETSQAKSITASYLLVTKHLLQSKTSL
ncbi:hypothetical protein [Photobacterium leiognathi]|uniref:hypothetical protein n=1 Tax=Photobacterium leiognathi TaxID=553611 RepID=UPI002980E788|nr:hypothetical protein [Photobacterium leiognathi]